MKYFYYIIGFFWFALNFTKQQSTSATTKITYNTYLSSVTQDISLMKKDNKSVSDTQLEYTQCGCNLTPNSCDFNCCCDLDCPVSLLTKWILDERDSCLDKKLYDNNSFTTCFDSNLLVYFNIKRGMREFTDGTLFCVSYDNSSQKAQYYNSLKVLSDKEVSDLFIQMEKLLNSSNKDYRFESINDNLRYDTQYQVNDFIYLYKNSTTITSNLESLATFNKMTLYNKGENEKCMRAQKVSFLNDIAETKCDFKMSSLSQCERYNWRLQSLYNFNFTYGNTNEPSQNSEKSNIYNITATLNKVYSKNFITGEVKLLDYFKVDDVITSLLTNDSECSCSNILSEVHYYIKLQPNKFYIDKVYMDIVLFDSIKGSCNSKVSYKFTNSLTWINSLSVYTKQGVPGYNYNSNILFAQKSKIKSNTFSVSKNGAILSVYEKDKKTCKKHITSEYLSSNEIQVAYSVFKNTTDPETNITSLVESVVKVNNTNYNNSIRVFKTLYQNSLDMDIKFGKNLNLECSIAVIDAVDYQNYCQNKTWTNLEMFNLDEMIKGYIGILGNSDPQYSNDWVKIINDNYDETTSEWDNVTNSCTFPNEIILTVLFGKASSEEDPQYYIISGKGETVKNKIPFSNNITFYFRIVFISSELNKIYLPNRVRPSIFPTLPLDIANPFTN